MIAASDTMLRLNLASLTRMKDFVSASPSDVASVEVAKHYYSALIDRLRAAPHVRRQVPMRLQRR
jgi:hypothetical protein